MQVLLEKINGKWSILPIGAESLAETMAIVDRICSGPPASAYAPGSLDALRIERSLPPEVVAQLDVIGSADPDATGLNHFTAQEVTTDD